MWRTKLQTRGVTLTFRLMMFLRIAEPVNAAASTLAFIQYFVLRNETFTYPDTIRSHFHELNSAILISMTFAILHHIFLYPWLELLGFVLGVYILKPMAFIFGVDSYYELGLLYFRILFPTLAMYAIAIEGRILLADWYTIFMVQVVFWVFEVTFYHDNYHEVFTAINSRFDVFMSIMNFGYVKKCD